MNTSSSILKGNTYLKFLVKLSIIVAIIVLLDFVVGSVLKAFYFRQTSGLEYRTTYSIDRTRADLLIFGSSTAAHDYIPTVFERDFNMSAYNVGRGGTSVFYDYAILRAVLKRYKPKMIILDFDNREFSETQESYDRLACLLPYYKMHPEIDSIVDLKSPYEKYKLLSNIYPFNSLLFTISANNSEANRREEQDINGYVPLTNVWNDPLQDDHSFLDDPIDSNKVMVYESFIRDCIHAKVKLYIFCSPLFTKPDYVNNTIQLGKSIAEKYRVKFVDFSTDPAILNRPCLFADIAHLNKNGALVYSNQVSARLLAEKRSIPDTR